MATNLPPSSDAICRIHNVCLLNFPISLQTRINSRSMWCYNHAIFFFFFHPNGDEWPCNERMEICSFFAFQFLFMYNFSYFSCEKTNFRTSEKMRSRWLNTRHSKRFLCWSLVTCWCFASSFEHKMRPFLLFSLSFCLFLFSVGNFTVFDKFTTV